MVPRRLRRRFFVKPVAKWLVPALRCIALPEADKRNRFLVPLWVFILVLALAFVISGSQLRMIQRFPAFRFARLALDDIASASAAKGHRIALFPHLLTIGDMGNLLKPLSRFPPIPLAG